MENTKIITKKIAIAILAILLLSSLAVLANLAKNNTAAAQDYGDLLQYEWPVAGADEGCTGFNAGPAPGRANVLWSVTGRGNSIPVAFDGKLWTASGSTVYCSDPFDGSLIYTSTAPGTPSTTGNNAIHKIDDTYFLTQGSGGFTVRKIATGELVWSVPTPGAARHPGSGQYFGGHYSTSMKLYTNHRYDTAKHEANIIAYDLSNPSTEPTVKWIYAADTAAELLCSGDGKIFLGGTEATVIALDGETGAKVWETATLGGISQQSGIYYNGNVYISAVSWQVACFDGETGELKWQTEKGIRAFSAYRGAAGHGMIFDSTVELDPHGHIWAWNAETGEPVWKQPAYFNIAYTTIAVADGKVVTSTCDQSEGIRTGGTPMPGYETTCFDAYTGAQLWKLRGINFATPSIAYGNVYGIYSNRLYCIGGDPADWTHGLHGNLENPRVAVGQTGPADISTPRWEFQTGGDVGSSPAVVDGRVYVGSHDKNWYCLDAYTGEKIWNFTVGHIVRSSCAVVGGRVFTGADDGYFYCLDAETGEKLWERSAGGFFPHLLHPNEGKVYSSPIVVGGRIFVGSLDGKVYCLSTSNGNVLNTYTTGGPIFGSPAYANGVVYIASTDGYFYALNADDLSFKWRSDFQLAFGIGVPIMCELYNVGTPNVAAGMVFIGSGAQYGTALWDDAEYEALGLSVPDSSNGAMRMYAFNATTGESIWNVTRTGNTQPLYIPTYWNGQIYAGEFFDVTAMNATHPKAGTHPPASYNPEDTWAGNRTAGQWLGYQIQPSVAYADDLRGPKIYVGSDVGSIYCLDPRDFSTLSVCTMGANILSSAAIWDGKMYVGTTNGKLYCFDDSPIVATSIFADADKGATMWNNETMLFCGTLNSHPSEIEYRPELDEEGNYLGGSYAAVPSTFTPPLPNQTVKLTFTKPGGQEETLTTTTDENGYFEFSYSPTDVGEWGWVVYYDANVKDYITYDQSYGEWMPFTVTSAPSGETPPPPTDGGFPMEYVYIAVAAIVIVLVAVGAYIFLKRK